MASAQIQGLDRLLKKLEKVGGKPMAKSAVKAVAVHVKGKVAKYPSRAGVRVAGHPSAWYERGYGSRWPRADGTIGGRKTSETLGRKWTIHQGSGLKTSVGNNVSYGPYVQDLRMQARIHRGRWKTIQEVAKKERGAAERILKDKYDEALEKS